MMSKLCKLKMQTLQMRQSSSSENNTYGLLGGPPCLRELMNRQKCGDKAIARARKSPNRFIPEISKNKNKNHHIMDAVISIANAVVVVKKINTNQR